MLGSRRRTGTVTPSNGFVTLTGVTGMLCAAKV